MLQLQTGGFIEFLWLNVVWRRSKSPVWHLCHSHHFEHRLTWRSVSLDVSFSFTNVKTFQLWLCIAFSGWGLRESISHNRSLDTVKAPLYCWAHCSVLEKMTENIVTCNILSANSKVTVISKQYHSIIIQNCSHYLGGIMCFTRAAVMWLWVHFKTGVMLLKW